MPAAKFVAKGDWICRSRRARQIHLQEAKIASGFLYIRAIFAVVGFVSALKGDRETCGLLFCGGRYGSRTTDSSVRVTVGDPASSGTDAPSGGRYSTSTVSGASPG